MKLTDGEKLIILMLTGLYKNLGIKGEIDPDFVESAILGDKLWGLSWMYSGISFSDEETPPIVSEVVDILEMWDFIHFAYEKLDEVEKNRLDTEAKLEGVIPVFEGFDGNYESEYLNTALFLINDLDRFECFKGKRLNSHCPSLDMHKRMLEKFNKYRHIFPDVSVATLAGILNQRFMHQDITDEQEPSP